MSSPVAPHDAERRVGRARRAVCGVSLSRPRSLSTAYKTRLLDDAGWASFHKASIPNSNVNVGTSMQHDDAASKMYKLDMKQWGWVLSDILSERLQIVSLWSHWLKPTNKTIFFYFTDQWSDICERLLRIK